MATYSFDTQEADQHGVDESILIQHFRSWITKYKLNGEQEHEGRTWTHDSNDAFSTMFYFWKPYQIRRILKSLVDQGVMVTGNYNLDRLDRTKWYAFEDEEKYLDIPSNNPENREKPTKNNNKGELTNSLNAHNNIASIPSPKASPEITCCKRIIEHLNMKTGRSFRAVPSNINPITARLNEGHTEADIRSVIDMKVREWLGNPKMEAYLRPGTLFNASKFNDYVGQIGIAPKLTEEEKTAAWINDTETSSNVFEGVFTREV